MQTRATGKAFRVVIRVLVEGDLEGRMLVAKDIAAAPAVVATTKGIEGLSTGSIIADIGGRIGLRRVLAGGHEMCGHKEAWGTRA